MWAAGLEQEAVFHMDSALALFRRANQIDEQYLPAQLSGMILLRKSGRALELRNKYELRSSSSPFTVCLNAIAWAISSHDVPAAQAAYTELVRRQGRTPCTEVARALINNGYDIRQPLLREALRRYGYAPRLMRELCVPMQVGENWGAILEMFRIQIASAVTPTMKLAYKLELVHGLQKAGNGPAAKREAGATGRDYATDSRPYVRWKLLEQRRSLLARDNANFVQEWRTVSAEMSAIALRNHAYAFEFDALLVSAIEDVDRGNLGSAIATLDQTIEIATRMKSPEFEMLAYLYRGRAFAAQGKEQAAIADLERSATAARRLGERYRLAEAYHHMAHAYEARGNWGQAITAADSFVAIGATVRDKSMRMIRLNDAAAIQWKAGYHARANEYSQQMVRTIDADSANYEYAGIYYERIGDLARARNYYRKAYESAGSGSPKLALAGLTRVYLELGIPDSAVITATRHDALIVPPEREILLPRIFARQGRIAEARALAAKWTHLQVANGNPAGAAAAINQEAELTLASNPRAALALADSAEDVARSVTSISQMVAAQRLRGLARARLGDASAGKRDVVAALALSLKMQDVFVPVTLKMDIASLAQEGGDMRGALVWYARAEAAAQAAATNFDDPVLIARFRNARREIFDGALRSVLKLPERERTAKFLEWSEIKKGGRAVRKFAAGTDPKDAAVLDYLTVGDTLMVTVHTGRFTQTVLLPISARAAADLSTRLVAPLREIHNGSIDIGRAVFSQEIASDLFKGLLKPIVPLLEGVASITIIPDVPLQLVPFDALVITRAPSGPSDYSRTGFAAARWNFSYAPRYSAALHAGRHDFFSRAKLLFISHSAPAVDNERTAIKAAWPSTRLNEIVGVKATERAIKNTAPGSIVHFATHAISDDVDPLRSHLVLQPAPGDDGLMHAREIRQRSWSRSLVFLSACETSAGPMFAGTGTLSLGRAFFDGGAEMVIATQWPVGSTSVDIVREFYSALSNGMPTSSALYAAKSMIRKNPATSHPFYWAAHILIVDPN